MHRVTFWPEHARLRAESERIRAESIRVRIAAVHAFCSVLQTEARWRSPEKAQEMMSRVWRAVGTLKQHLAEPKLVSAEWAGELLRALAALEERALRIHETLYGPWRRAGARAALPRRVRVAGAAERDPQTRL